MRNVVHRHDAHAVQKFGGISLRGKRGESKFAARRVAG